MSDRTSENIDQETVSSGRSRIFTDPQEAELMVHLKVMAECGFGYSRQDVVDLATDFAIQLGVRDKHHPCSSAWYRSFESRWPELRDVKLRSIEVARGKVALAEKYFEELEGVIKVNGLQENPHLIYNVNEKAFFQIHSLPMVKKWERTGTITVICCGSASGSAVPPFFVFPEEKMMRELMEGATPGAEGGVSEYGWSSSQLFRDYLEDHFLKHVQMKNGEKVLLVLDGHKSHLSVRLTQWARERNIILCILSPRTSHILQPLEVGCFEPMEQLYNSECKKFLHKRDKSQRGDVVRYNICEKICKAYNEAMSAVNLIAAFQETGIHPLDRRVISPENLNPSEADVGEPEANKIKEGSSSKGMG